MDEICVDDVVKNFVDNKKKEKLNDEVLKFYCVI
jgi:hypothetical protein